MSRFLNKLDFRDAGIVNGNRWIRIVAPLAAETEYGIVEVPEAFMSDGASIPSLAWSIVGHPFSGYLDAAVVHDYLYTKAAGDLGLTRQEADDVLRDLMGVLGYGWFKRNAFYWSVRSAGWAAYQKR